MHHTHDTRAQMWCADRTTYKSSVAGSESGKKDDELRCKGCRGAVSRRSGWRRKLALVWVAGGSRAG